MKSHHRVGTNNAHSTNRSDDTPLDHPQVHIDHKGRLSVDATELAASKRFRKEVAAMRTLAETHPCLGR